MVGVSGSRFKRGSAMRQVTSHKKKCAPLRFALHPVTRNKNNGTSSTSWYPYNVGGNAAQPAGFPPRPPPSADYNADMKRVKGTLGPSYCRGPGLPEHENNCNPETKTTQRERGNKAAGSQRQQHIVGKVLFRQAGRQAGTLCLPRSSPAVDIDATETTGSKSTPQVNSRPPCRLVGV